MDRRKGYRLCFRNLAWDSRKIKKNITIEEMNYSEKALEHFRNPHNVGKIENPDGIGKVGNIVCGDVMWIYIKVKENKKKEEFIQDIKFETFGCVAALATSSALTDLAKGKTLEKALRIKNEDIINFLGDLPPIKIHCSLLAIDGLSEAIYDYLSKKGKDIPEKLKLRHGKALRELEIIEEKNKKE